MLKILYLEDNKFDIELTQIALLKAFPDCKIDTMRSVIECKNHITETSDYDVAILDLNLPDGNGVDALVHIRQLELEIVVIILTGSGNEEAAIAALKAGANDYVPKKIGYLNNLPDVVKNAIENFKVNLANKAQIIHVLYIEWNKHDIDLTERHMRRYAPQIQIESVKAPDEALHILDNYNSSKPAHDVLLIDYRLQHMNALEVIKIIRQEKKLPIPIVLVTGYGNEDIAVQSLKMGADEYIVKRENYLFRLPSLLVSVKQKYELRKNQKELEESEAKYRLLAENSSDIIFVLDLNYNYVYLSPSGQRLRGFKAEDVKNNNFSEFLTPESNQKIKNEIERLKALFNSKKIYKAEPRIFEIEMYKSDGSIFWAEVKFSVMFDDNKLPIGFQGVTRDITARRKATEELRKVSRAIEQSNASVVITDLDGFIEYVNPKFVEISGYSLEEVKEKKLNILKSGEMPDELYNDLWGTIKSGKSWKGELLNRRKNGQRYWENVSISSIKDNNGIATHLLAIKEDITEKKKFEEELIVARNQAEESNRLKSAFLATMSHELRTPLNAIIGFSDIADENMEKERLISFFKTINTSGKHLLTIIEDIFSLSLLQSGESKVIIEDIKLSDFIMSIIQYANIELERRNKKNLHLKYADEILQSDVEIRTDKTKLLQILINFLKNAVEYTENGEIEIGVLQAENEFIFFVRDTGIGIPEDKISLIFERFRQLDDTFTRTHGGVGLGLSIVSEAAKLLNGKLSVKSEPNKGSVFYFTLENVEVKKTGSNINHTKSVIFPDLTSKTILIAEDVETNYLLLYNILKKTNATILWAKTGEQAIEICRDNRTIDLIFMDIRMPGLNGYETADEIKKIMSVPIIAQTAFAFPSDEELAKASSCDDYLAKPILMSDLDRLLRKYL